MAWQKQATVKTGAVAYQARAFGGTLVFRGADTLFAWDGTGEALAWMSELPGDDRFGAKLLADAGGAAVTVLDRGSRKPFAVRAHDPATGALRWERELKGKITELGLAADADQVYVHDWRGDDFVLVRLDAATGKARGEDEARHGRGLFLDATWLYLHAEDGGLYYSPPGKVAWKRADDLGALGDVALGAGEVVCFEARGGEWSVAAWSAAEERVTGRVATGLDHSMQAAPLERPGTAAVYDPSEVRLVDFARGETVWMHRPEGGAAVKAVAATPFGVVAAVRPDTGRNRLVALALEDGSVAEELPATRGEIRFLYWLGGTLVASALDGLESFVHTG